MMFDDLRLMGHAIAYDQNKLVFFGGLLSAAHTVQYSLSIKLQTM